MLNLAPAAAIVLAFAAPATAASVTFNDTHPLSDVDISGTLSVPGFDTALGTLDSVDWEITGSIASILGITNDSAGTLTVTAHTNVDFDLDSALLSLGASPDFGVFASTGQVTLGVGESALFPLTSNETLTGSEAPAAGFLLPGTVDVAYQSTTSFGASGGGDLTVSQATDAGISLTVTYNSTPIPEPASAALLALTGLLVTRRRRA
jgi:hypothetical protein